MKKLINLYIKDYKNKGPGSIFTRLHFLRNLRMGPISAIMLVMEGELIVLWLYVMSANYNCKLLLTLFPGVGC